MLILPNVDYNVSLFLVLNVHVFFVRNEYRFLVLILNHLFLVALICRTFIISFISSLIFSKRNRSSLCATCTSFVHFTFVFLANKFAYICMLVKVL